MVAYGDGVITRRNTFQKNYEQEELKVYIDQVLGVDAIPVALGIYLIFRDEAQAQTFRASHWMIWVRFAIGEVGKSAWKTTVQS